MSHSARRRTPSLLAAVAVAGLWTGVMVPQAGAQTAPVQDLPEVLVMPAQQAADPFDVPASVDAVPAQEALRLGASPAELLQSVPGVVARDRHNYAQDTQIAIRGFGARSAFGVRGVRVVTDGIPATQPDGQGQLSHLNLASAERIEVLRGPFSALYGNASGGVVQIVTRRGEGAPSARLDLVAGGFDAARASVGASGSTDALDYTVDLTHFRSDGAREHSRARRNSANTRLDHSLAGGGTLTLIGNSLDQPWTQDPLGLTWTQFREDPTQVADPAITFNTRKRVSQHQVGAVYRSAADRTHQLHAMVYAGQRDITQFLAIPVAAQNAPRHAGGVIDLDNGYGGGELRWSGTWALDAGSLTLHAGMAADTLHQRRRGHENFVDGTLGVRGALRRDERIVVDALDPYLQADWRIGPRWSLLAGMRHSRVRMRVDDAFVTAANPDDSGRVGYHALTPVAGVLWHATQQWNLYASYGEGFETPTVAEVAYRADGGSGLAFDLAPVTSRSVEVGSKWRHRDMRLTLAAFRTDSRDELAVATASGGRTTYRNVSGSRRQGLEAALDWRPHAAWRVQAAATVLDAAFTDAFLGCSDRCDAPNTLIPAGTPLPGVPRRNGFLALQWMPSQGWEASLDLHAVGGYSVNDAGTAHAPGHAVAGAEAGYRWQSGARRWRAFLRIDNLADRQHIGSVIVNDGNGRYYEPGTGREWLIGLRLE